MDQVDDMKTAMQEILDKYPALDGVFCTNAVVSELFLDTYQDDGTRKVAMVGVDATSRQQEAIKNGVELGALSQNPYAMGYQTMWAAIQSTAPRKEVKIEKTQLLDPAWIDADSLEELQQLYLREIIRKNLIVSHTREVCLRHRVSEIFLRYGFFLFFRAGSHCCGKADDTYKMLCLTKIYKKIQKIAKIITNLTLFYHNIFIVEKNCIKILF